MFARSFMVLSLGGGDSTDVRSVSADFRVVSSEPHGRLKNYSTFSPRQHVAGSVLADED